MTIQNKLDQVRAKVIEAVPEIVQPVEDCNNENCYCRLPIRPITLADVLRAIDATSNEAIVLETGGRMTDIRTATNHGFSGSIRLNLALPLDDQEPEVIEFLHKIICV